MKRVLIAGLALALSATSASALPQQSAEDDAYGDDLVCAVVYMAVAADGADPAEFAAGFYYFLGRMQARRPDADWLSQILTSAANSGHAVLLHHAERCGQIMKDKSGGIDRIGEVIEQWSRGEGQMGAALQSLDDDKDQQPASGW